MVIHEGARSPPRTARRGVAAASPAQSRPGMQRAGMQSSMRSLNSLKGPGMQSMRSLSSLKPAKQSVRGTRTLDRHNSGHSSMASKSPDSSSWSKSPDSDRPDFNSSLTALALGDINEDETIQENANKLNDIMEMESLHETKRSAMDSKDSSFRSNSGRRERTNNSGREERRTLRDRTGSLGRRFNFTKMMSFRPSNSIRDEEEAPPPPPPATGPGFFSSEEDDEMDDFANLSDDQFDVRGSASPMVMRRTRSKSPGRRNRNRSKSPGRRVTGSQLPRRMLKGQRSERPGIMMPGVAPSYRRANAKSIGFDENGNAKSVVMNERQSLMMNDHDTDPRVTKLHELAADPDTTVEALRLQLEEDPRSASIVDHDGKLPLHIISENVYLTEKLGDSLDKFILDELIPRNRRALVAQSNDGHFPFVQALMDWVELINEIPQRRMSEMGMSLEKNDDAAEQLIPWNVVIDDIASWGIKMLSIMIEREPLKAMWVLKIVEVMASIPCFLKNILLIDDDNTRRELMETRLIHEVILHENSVGPWLVYMIVSDDEIAQARALMYLKLVTDIEQTLSSETGQSSRTRISTAFDTSNHKILERKHKVYLKAAGLPAIIPALMQFRKDHFTEASSSSLVQFILDQALFQPETVLVILLDIFFLFAAVILYTISSNKVFAFVSSIKFAPTVQFYTNQTAYDLCANGTLTGENSACNFFSGEFSSVSAGVVTFGDPSGVDCGISCQVCSDPSAFEGSVLPYDPSLFLTDLGTSPLMTCYDGNTGSTIDTFLIAAIMFMVLNALYFSVRQLCTWLTVPHRYLRSQFGFLRVFLDVISVAFPVVLLAVFLAYVYDLPTIENGYISPEYHAAWLQNAQTYAACSAVAVGLLYLKILFYFKVLNQYTATFIFALGEVVKDIFWFVWIMVVIIFAFSQMFYTTLSCTGGYCRNPSVNVEVFGSGSPFDEFANAILYSYSILLGQIDLFLFDTVFTTLLWVFYTFSVVIVVLNFLIAIVGDSYDKSMTKIETHFGRARLMFMVEVSAFLSYVVAPLSSTDEMDTKGIRRWLLCGSWKGTLTYFVFAIGLFTGFTFLTIEQDILDRSGEDVFVTLAVVLVLLVLSPFLWKFGCFGFLSRLKIFQILGQILTGIFRLFLGKSIRGDRTDKEKKDWGGRIAHLITSMDACIRESEEITNRNITNLETTVNRSIERVEYQMRVIQNDNLDSSERSSLDMENRVSRLESNVLDIKALVSNIHAMMEESRELSEASDMSNASNIYDS